MLLSRLLLPKPPSRHFHRTGLGIRNPTPRCLLSSSSSSSSSSDIEAEKSSNLKPPESCPIKHIEMKPPNSLNATDDQGKGKRSRYSLKDIFTNLKGMVLGNSPDHINTGSLDCATNHFPVNHEKSEDTAKSFEGVMNSHMYEKGIAQIVTDESFSLKSINPSISDALPIETNTKKNVDGMKLSGPDGNKDFDALPSISESINPSISDALPIETNTKENVDGMKLSGPDGNKDFDALPSISESINPSISDALPIETNTKEKFDGMKLSGPDGNKDFDALPSISESINPSISDALPMHTSTEDNHDGMKLSEPNGNKDIAEAVLGRLRVVNRDHHQSNSEQLSFSTEIVKSGKSFSSKKISRNNQAHKEIISKMKSFLGPELDHRPTLSAGTGKHNGLAEIFMRPMNSETDRDATGKPGSVLTSTLANLNEKGGEDAVSSIEITSLINCLKDLPEERPIKSDDTSSDKDVEICSQGLRKLVSSWEPLLTDQRTDSNIRKSNTEKKTQVSCMADKNCMNEDENRRKSIGEALNDMESELTPQFPLEMSKEEPIEHPKIAVENKTGKSAKNALDRTAVLIKGADVMVEATSSAMKNLHDEVSIPGLIGYPGVPLALVKNPICTVVVRNLTWDISSCHLRETLAICGGEISGVFFGPSNSDAYVEFKTEVAKERAIAKHSINVLGKWLTICRIDVPRTTVVRISNINPKSLAKVHPICHRCGIVKHVTRRSMGISDVYYNLTEWPNMLKILNRLNGRKEDGNQWVAQPAPVFPPKILKVLWSQPDERRRLKDIMCSCLHEFGEKPLNTAGLTELVATFCSDRI